MKLIIILALCFTLLSSGCMEQKDNDDDREKSSVAENGVAEKIKVNITSPVAGQIIQGDKDLNFDASVKGGKGALNYEWSSSIDGKLSTSQSFKQNPADLGKGRHVIILKVTDENGNSGQGSVLVEVM